MSFLTELNRRNVVRVAAAYVVIGWLLLQVADTLAPLFDLPDGVNKFIFLLLLVGFVPVVVFAWAFELTPEGIKREKSIDRSESTTHTTAKRLDVVTIVAAILVAIMVAWQQFAPAPAADTAAQRAAAGSNSIAVLAFADLSATGDQGYFADGIAVEIHNVLSRLPGLRVPGTTSSFYFKNTPASIREISTELGVEHVLEGSVRRSGDRLRVTATLLRGDDGSRLWTETYDRTVADVFDIQDEIARNVAAELAVSLGLADERAEIVERTDDPRVYDNYLRAYQLFLQRGKRNLDDALLLLQEAVARDPEYAQAWTGIAFVYAVYESYLDEFPDRNFALYRSLGEQAARRAIALDPDNAIAHGTLGIFLDYRGERIEAFQHIDRALELTGYANADLLDLASQHLQEAGYFVEARELSEKAIALDPLVPVYYASLSSTEGVRGNYDRTEEYLLKGKELDPSNPFVYMVMTTLGTIRGDADRVRTMVLEAAEKASVPMVAEANTARVLAVWDDPDALRELFGQLSWFWDMNLAIRLRDTELALRGMEAYWSLEGRKELGVFRDFRLPLVNNHPRWKEQVRRDGLVELWRERGLPQHCRFIGDDDFECELLHELPAATFATDAPIP